MLWVLLILVLLILGISFVLYCKLFANFKRKKEQLTLMSGPEYQEMIAGREAAAAKCQQIPAETVYVQSYDGKKLCGKLYMQNENAPWHILHHAYRGGSFQVMAPSLLHFFGRGENVLLLHLRSQGESEGHTITFGIQERRDTGVWADYLVNRFGQDTKIFLYGVSMGAATVLMACGLELPRQVRGVIADCPYSSPVGVMTTVAGGNALVSKIVTFFAFMSAFVFGHFNILETSPLEAVQKTKAPVLLIHGTGDTFVPFSMSEDIQKANPEMVRLVPIEGAPHAGAILKDPDTYGRAVADFIADCTACSV